MALTQWVTMSLSTLAVIPYCAFNMTMLLTNGTALVKFKGDAVQEVVALTVWETSELHMTS